MIEDLISLKLKFEKIKKMGWIESMRNGTTGIGYTFERLLGKPEESFPIPDYRSIEIKTRYRNAKRDITLFNATPDGDFLFPMKRIYENYGIEDSKYKNCKKFYASISTKPKYAGKNHRFKLKIDKENEVIKVIAIDKTNKQTDINVSWSFNFLKEKIERKIKYLALVKADCTCNIELQFFHYYEITFYMLRSFNKFVELIEEGIIKTTFMIGFYKSGPKYSEMNNHGVGFDIAEEDLDKLFYKVC